MDIKKHTFEAVIGSCVLLCAIIFVYHVIKSSGTKSISSKSLIVYAKFTNVDGIEIGSDIKIGGVKIGVVSEKKIDLVSYKAFLTLAIDFGINIPSDSNAAIVSSGLLGGKYIDIRPGNEEDYLKNGDKIEYTQSSINIEELIGKFAFGGNKK